MLNYTTKIDASKTVGEIQQILARHGVRKIVIDYDPDGQPSGLTFIVEWNGIPTLYALPCRWEGVQKQLARHPKMPRTPSLEHARRVAWRIIKDWIEAQLAIIQAGVVSLPEVFLPYAVTKNGETMYELVSGQRDQFLLEGGSN